MKPTTSERFSLSPPRITPPMFEPKSTSGRRLSRNAVAKITPGEEDRHEDHQARRRPPCAAPGRARKRVHRHDGVDQQRRDQQRVVGPEPPRPDRQDVQVAQEDHHQDREEDDRVDHPGRAEQQGHVDDALGLQQHEARAEEEHLAVGPGRPHRREGEQDRQRERRHDRHAAEVQRGDRRLAEVEERPVVGRQRADARASRPRPGRSSASRPAASPGRRAARARSR